MRDRPPRCSFCEGQAIFGPFESVHVCKRCAVRIAGLAIDVDEKIWETDVVRVLTPREPVVVPGVPDPDQVLKELKEDVAQHLSIDDAESHFALAQAYTEMGLYLDARREAGIAVRARRESPSRTTHDALRLLLSEPLLPAGRLRRLHERLRRPLH